MKSAYKRDTCIPMFIAVLFTAAKLWNQPWCPSMDEWIKKMCYICAMEYYSATEKNDMLSFAAHVNQNKPDQKN
jgi:hypothetical protein